MKDDGHFKEDEVKPRRENYGHYCAWGVWHSFYEEPCKHFATTGVPPEYMRRMKKELYPHWQDGQQGRPPKNWVTDAMTGTMQRTIIEQYYRENPEKILAQ